MSDRTYCRLTLLYLFWLLFVAWLGIMPMTEGTDVFLWRAYAALYPTAGFWVLGCLVKGAFRRFG